MTQEKSHGEKLLELRDMIDSAWISDAGRYALNAYEIVDLIDSLIADMPVIQNALDQLENTNPKAVIWRT